MAIGVEFRAHEGQLATGKDAKGPRCVFVSFNSTALQNEVSFIYTNVRSLGRFVVSAITHFCCVDSLGVTRAISANISQPPSLQFPICLLMKLRIQTFPLLPEDDTNPLVTFRDLKEALCQDIDLVNDSCLLGHHLRLFFYDFELLDHSILDNDNLLC